MDPQAEAAIDYAALVDEAIAESDAKLTPEDRKKFGEAWTQAALMVVGGGQREDPDATTP